MEARSEAVVPVHVVDDTGALLLVTEAVATPEAAPVAEGDVLQKILRGRELPRTGPTTVPTLRLEAEPEPEPEVTLIDAPDGALDAPSGSALSTVDMTTLFGPVGALTVAHGRDTR